MMKEQETIQETAENNIDAADFGINADDNAAGTTHLNDPIEEESEIEKLNANPDVHGILLQHPHRLFFK